jgi:integrase
MLEVTRSLRTGSLSKAQRLVVVHAARLMETFEMLRSANYTKERARHVIQACFRDLAQDVEGQPRSYVGDSDLAVFEQECMADDAITDLSLAVFGNKFSEGFATRAKRALAAHGVAVDDLPQEAFDDLIEGYARAVVEQQRLFKFRLMDRLSPYTFHDKLLEPVALPPAASGVDGQSSPLSGPSLKEVADHYLKEKRAGWTEKTYRTNSAKLSLMVEHLGASKPIAAVTPQDVRGFRDAVRRLHREYRHRAGTGFSAKQTEVVAERIAPKTAKLIFETTKAFFRWAASDAYITANPALEIRVDVTFPAKTSFSARRPFNAAELEMLFSSPTFTGCRSVRHRFEPGKQIIRDAKFWVPILGYYTGARLGEIVQLHLTDVAFEAPTAFIDVNEEGNAAGGDRKHVKSVAGVRRIPLHPDLLELGFEAFVRRRQADKSGHKRLFHEIRYGADGQASTTASKWFGRLLGSCGLDDPGLVFHSFRHGIQDAFKNALTPQYVTDQIVGHADGKVSSGYGAGLSLDVKAEAVRSLKLPLSLLRVIRPAP